MRSAESYEVGLAALRIELAEAKLDIDRLKIRLCDARTTLTQFAAHAERVEKELYKAKEQAHYANGVADLAMKHRNRAEKEADSLRNILYRRCL